MLGYQLGVLTAIALSEGRSCNDAEGGCHHDMPDHEVLSHVVELAQGSPHNEKGLSIDSLTDSQREAILRAFLDGAYDR